MMNMTPDLVIGRELNIRWYRAFAPLIFKGAFFVFYGIVTSCFGYSNVYFLLNYPFWRLNMIDLKFLRSFFAVASPTPSISQRVEPFIFLPRSFL